MSSEESGETAEDETFNALEEDAFLVFRALCKLAKKPGDLTNPAVARGKTLSLELLRILLENWIWGSLSQFMDDSLRVDVMPL